MIEYSKRELEAMDKADDAFAEVRKVADEFARQTALRYVRTVNCYFSTSTFVTRWPSADNRWCEVHGLYHGDNNEAYECAQEIEATWNAAIGHLYDRYDKDLCGHAFANDWHEEQYYDKRIDDDLAANERLRDKIGGIIERWYDTASETAYEDYLCEVA